MVSILHDMTLETPMHALLTQLHDVLKAQSQEKLRARLEQPSRGERTQVQEVAIDMWKTQPEVGVASGAGEGGHRGGEAGGDYSGDGHN